MKTACVVIPVHRATPRLLSCLEALAGQDMRSDLSVVISLDGPVELPPEFSALADQVVAGAKAGPAAARNRGFRAGGGRFVLFTDSDCIPGRGWARALVDCLETGFDAVKGVYSSGGRKLIQRLQQVEFEERYARLSGCGSVELVDTYSAGFRREALEAVGGFDESFPAADHEDVDLSYRMSDAGLRLGFCPAASVRHEHRGTWRGYFLLKFSRGRWRAKVASAHPRRTASDSYLPAALKLQVLLAVMLPPSLLAWAATPIVPAAWLAVFLASTIPMVGTALGSDPPVAVFVPVLALARCTALAMGLFAGATRLGGG